MRDAWLIVGISLFLLLALEGGLRILAFGSARLGAGTDPGPAVSEVYPDTTWYHDYWTEFGRSYAMHWWPYVYWRRNPHEGAYINVNRSGLRVTPPAQAGSPLSDAPLQVFMFGGSAMWGTGVRDEHTIPAIVARELAAHGVASEVTNFGETGYVSTQGVLALLLQLRAGNVPDVVVFYDGVNDLFSAFQQGVAGVPQNEFHRVREFNLSQWFTARQRRRLVMQDLTSRLLTVQHARRLLGMDRVPFQASVAVEPAWLNLGGVADEGRAEAVVSTYAANLDFVGLLAERYGFHHFFYWQPTIFAKPHLTPSERLRRVDMEDVGPFVAATHAALLGSGLLQDAPTRVQDLTDVFADVHDPIFIDWIHTGEAGNAILARRMARDLIALQGQPD